ncbi:hypothetical protein GGS21DRAFT_249742 [Xylaria nigripes]|nr:hypothetical protein GGS21DRAFT_249742 [Xylaria nigripes]
MSTLRTSVSQVARILPSHASRPLHQSAAFPIPYKDDMDRESLKPKSHEYTQSGTDDEVASAHSKASFDPAETSPEDAKETAAKEAVQQGKQNPLEASPADLEFAKGGAVVSEKGTPSGRPKRSGAGDAPKGKEVN